MHRLTCMEADRLARDLRRAEHYCRDAAHHHADMYAAMRILGSGVLAEYHHAAHADAVTTANEIADYATRLQERIPLWANGIGPADEPRPAVRLPRRTERAIGGRR